MINYALPLLFAGLARSQGDLVLESDITNGYLSFWEDSNTADICSSVDPTYQHFNTEPATGDLSYLIVPESNSYLDAAPTTAGGESVYEVVLSSSPGSLSFNLTDILNVYAYVNGEPLTFYLNIEIGDSPHPLCQYVYMSSEPLSSQDGYVLTNLTT